MYLREVAWSRRPGPPRLPLRPPGPIPPPPPRPPPPPPPPDRAARATFYFGANADHFTYTHVQADIRRTGAETVGDDLFVGAEGVRIQTAILRVHDVWFAATRRKRRPGVELVVPGQIAAGGHVVGGSRVVGEKGSQRYTVGRGEVPQDHETVVNIEAASSIVKPWILSDGRSVGDSIGIGFRGGVGVESEEAEPRVTGPCRKR